VGEVGHPPLIPEGHIVRRWYITTYLGWSMRPDVEGLLPGEWSSP
jgi:hypothetical protein